MGTEADDDADDLKDVQVSTDEKGARSVPYDTFRASRKDLRTARGQVKELNGKLAGFDEVTRERDTLKQRLADLEADGALRDAGLTDPEDRELAKYFYNKLPEQGRGPLADVVKGWKADATKAPRPLRERFGDAGKGSGGGGTAGGDQGKGSGGGDGKGGQRVESKGADANSSGAAHGDPVSAEKIREAYQKAQKTGDWTEYKRLRGMKTE